MALLVWAGYALLLAAARDDAHPTSYVGRRLSNVAGPFRAVVERFESCPPLPAARWEEAEEAVIVNVTHLSRQWGSRPRPQRLSGNLTLLLPLDDTTATLLTIDKWSNNQWKRNAFVMRLPGLCSALRGLGILPDSLCPVGEGVYPFRDLLADWRFPAMPQFYYGSWRAEAVFSQDGARRPRRGCVRWLFQTSPAWPEEWPPEQINEAQPESQTEALEEVS